MWQAESRLPATYEAAYLDWLSAIGATEQLRITQWGMKWRTTTGLTGDLLAFSCLLLPGSHHVHLSPEPFIGCEVGWCNLGPTKGPKTLIDDLDKRLSGLRFKK